MFISTAKAARILDMHPKTLTAIARRGVIPGAKKFGRLWRFRHEDFIAWAEGDSDRQRGVVHKGTSNGKTVNPPARSPRRPEDSYAVLLDYMRK